MLSSYAAFAFLFVASSAGAAPAASAGVTVEVVDVDDTIDAGMAHRVERAVSQARSSGAGALLVVLKTNGGVVDDANDIRDALGRDPALQTVAFVAERAWSAGALIALACDKIVMAPGSSMGAAEPIPTTPKTISALRAEMVALAEQHHRNADIAAGMSDPDVVIPGLKTKGTILSLSPG
ncbi:MAG: nodulation protein NfeD, partial [Candidatus Eremiobacteraeota bacterium]|nr:nodulation protein NfeD [Candidatus Eremiobacteraeota bacterium]